MGQGLGWDRGRVEEGKGAVISSRKSAHSLSLPSLDPPIQVHSDWHQQNCLVAADAYPEAREQLLPYLEETSVTVPTLQHAAQAQVASQEVVGRTVLEFWGVLDMGTLSVKRYCRRFAPLRPPF